MAKLFVETKVWWQSKTLIVNILALIGGILLAVSDHMATGGIITFAAVVNIALRIVTKHAVKW